ncbi:MAG: FAD:protein FMN transferase [Clostridia bacterium]|nr:FAD:protein FMN transferase [Clostridia bacterium]
MLAALMLAGVLLSGCQGKRMTRYQATLLDLFDTVTSITGYAESEERFRETVGRIEAEMTAYDHLYDIYREYPDLVNLCTVNRRPGETLEVDRRIVELLVFAREIDEKSGHRTDAMLGSVLRLWHDAREAGNADPEHAAVPGEEALRDAAEHAGFRYLELDEEKGTVRLTDEGARLDVGALAKGFAVARIAEGLPEGFLLSVGGNVAATGAKPDGAAWIIGVQDPDGGEGYLHRLSLQKGAVVTSGDYQRFYVAEGKTWHHIIDPETLMPGTRWRGVTVVCQDSGVGDALSTSLFLMTKEEGEKLLAEYGAEAMWIAPDGTEYFSGGFQALMMD